MKAASNYPEGFINYFNRHFHSVVPIKDSDILLKMDFSINNRGLNQQIFNETNLFIQYINNELLKAGAKYGIGGYNELRSFYKRSKLFDTSTEEPRQLHLGIDIWGKPYTPVMAPLDGIIHSFAFNNSYGDYGATIILSHQPEGFIFYTLYGHLSLNSIKNIQEGNTILAGDVFAEFGIPFENGQWPPHLHFQIIMDLKGMKGDFPGVCKFSERESWLANCPDPDLILRLMDASKITNNYL